MLQIQPRTCITQSSIQVTKKQTKDPCKHFWVHSSNQTSTQAKGEVTTMEAKGGSPSPRNRKEKGWQPWISLLLRKSNSTPQCSFSNSTSNGFMQWNCKWYKKDTWKATQGAFTWTGHGSHSGVPWTATIQLLWPCRCNMKWILLSVRKASRSHAISFRCPLRKTHT